MFKKTIYLIIILATLISCNKKKLELPLIPVGGISNITNHSEIWVFYNVEKEKNKANINKNNIISTTNWIINIDKKLQMKEVVPAIQLIKAKREKKTPHSAEGVSDYLSYANNKDKNISLFKIDSIQYLSLDKISSDDLAIHYKSDNNIIFREKNISINNKEILIDSLKLENFTIINSKRVHVFFEENITYQSYLEKRVKLSQIAKGKIIVDGTEYMLINR